MPRLQCDQRQQEGIVAEGESKNASELDGRNEVIHEALAEEVQRGEQRKKRSDKATAAVPESKPAASAASEPREAPVEPDPNPNRI